MPRRRRWPFNSLLRDQVSLYWSISLSSCSTFNSLLRDQSLRLHDGGPQVILSILSCEIRSWLKCCEVGWMDKLSILSCEIRCPYRIISLDNYASFNSLLRDQPVWRLGFAESSAGRLSILSCEISFSVGRGTGLFQGFFQFSLARSVGFGIFLPREERYLSILSCEISFGWKAFLTCVAVAFNSLLRDQRFWSVLVRFSQLNFQFSLARSAENISMPS